MNPIDFPQATKTLGPPPSMDNCGGLRVWTDGECTVSYWMPTDEERAKIAAGEPIVLWVVFRGGTQPPVALQVGSPFEVRALAETDAQALRDLGISPEGA